MYIIYNIYFNKIYVLVREIHKPKVTNLRISPQNVQIFILKKLYVSTKQISEN